MQNLSRDIREGRITQVLVYKLDRLSRSQKDTLYLDVYKRQVQHAADGSLANTPLMKQLADHPQYTVAQFGQAVGAIYYGCVGLEND